MSTGFPHNLTWDVIITTRVTTTSDTQMEFGRDRSVLEDIPVGLVTSAKRRLLLKTEDKKESYLIEGIFQNISTHFLYFIDI